MSDDATAALVHYLRIEADLSELKAQRLTQQADQLALEHGLQGTELQILDASEMAPLDEFGIPKYRGKYIYICVYKSPFMHTVMVVCCHTV
jgi:hypothetical protein